MRNSLPRRGAGRRHACKMLKDFVIRAPLPVPLVTTGGSSSFDPAAMTDVPLQVVLVYDILALEGPPIVLREDRVR